MENNLSKTVHCQNFFKQSLTMVTNIIKTYVKDSSSYLKEKIPTKMQKSFYWKNSFINGFKTNTAFALFATFAYPLNIVSGKKAILLQTLFIIKNIICLRMFSNNSDSTYCSCKSYDKKSVNFDHAIFLNDFIAPYSVTLLGTGLLYGGMKQIIQLTHKTSVHQLFSTIT